MKNSIEMFGAPMLGGQISKYNGPSVGQVLTAVAVVGVATLIVVIAINTGTNKILAKMREHDASRNTIAG